MRASWGAIWHAVFDVGMSGWALLLLGALPWSRRVRRSTRRFLAARPGNDLPVVLVAVMAGVVFVAGCATVAVRRNRTLTVQVAGRKAHDPSLPDVATGGPSGLPPGVRPKPAVVTYDISIRLLPAVLPTAEDVVAAAFGTIVAETDVAGDLVLATDRSSTPCAGAFIRPAPRLLWPGHRWRLADPGGPDRELAAEVVLFEKTDAAHDFVTDFASAGTRCGYAVVRSAARPDIEAAVAWTWRDGAAERELLVLQSANVVVQIGTRLAAAEGRPAAARLGDAVAAHWTDVVRKDRDDGDQDHRIGY